MWRTAFYAGLRSGELKALRWDDVSLLDGVIDVRRGWDTVEGEIAPKSRTGVRKVPIPDVLARLLEARYSACGGDGLVFGTGARPFDARRLLERARAAWTERDLRPVTLHECRHTYASFAIAAGVNAKKLSTYMGHANIAITFDLYGHLVPGNESGAATLLDAYLEPSESSPE